MILGLAILLGGLVLSRLVRWVTEHLIRWRGRSPGSARVFGRLAAWTTVLLSVMAALTVVFPSIRPVDVLGGVGVVSIAAGIAFQTVLGNMFAGIVLLTRDRFRTGDQIEVREHRGTITRIDLTSSTLRTFDGRLVVVPNAVLHSEVVSVQTGFEQVRTTVTISVDDSADLERAREVAVRAMQELACVLDDPRPDALFSEVGSATVTLELRFWSGALQLETRSARHEVICAVLKAFRDEGVSTGSDVLMVDAGPRLAELVARGGKEPRSL